MLKALSRKLVSISGRQHLEFLQRITTTNIFQNKKLLYSLFLDGSGRILFDTMIHLKDSVSYLETDRLNDLFEYLNSLIFRSDVSISVLHNKSVLWTKWENFTLDKPSIAHVDPRLPQLGLRAICCDPSVDIEDGQYEYENVLLINGIIEGSQNLKGRLPHIFNFDLIPDVISRNKGCYTGQEYVMRLLNSPVRRRLLSVRNVPPGSKNLYSKKNIVGNVMQNRNGNAVAIVKLDSLQQGIFALNDSNNMQEVDVLVPHWLKHRLTI
ncbi:hypothetical protein GJ496_001655 [Pomphorhynchus laevis]|nr:hypothetical protein GJ496_001655 [Pomphorhynchus laevis]